MKHFVPKPRDFLIALGVVIILFGYFTIRSQEQLPTKKNARLEYEAEITPEKKACTVLEGEPAYLSFKLKNTGEKAWNHLGEKACLFSYHLLAEAGEVIQFDNRRFSLPLAVAPGQSIEFKAAVQSPLTEGTYILEFDLLREGIAWFNDYGSPTAEVVLKVKKRAWKDNLTWFHSTLNEINLLPKLIRITLKENEVNFKGKSGPVFGFLPGINYPQIWIRDSNSIISASRYFYSPPYLSSWLEEHLYHQKEDGALCDWIDIQGNKDKNTTQTDQESSAVQAAYKAYGLLGKDWLRKNIRGVQIVDRLECALEYVLQNRWDEKLGLLIGAHTADWGDVDIVDKGQDAVYVNQKTVWTADIYDQAMFYKACRELAEMLESLGEKKKAEKWHKIAQNIRRNTNQNLWQEDKGFYRIHLHLSPLEHEFDEDDIFALGGNTLAVLSGIADPHKTQKIIQTALSRQNQYTISTISGSLLPPYPENTFQHPLMDQPYEYQNGGQWDWFGAQLIFAMFENGFSQEAQTKLLEVIAKNMKNRGFFEWDTREGSGMGSALFCGSAGSLAQAVVEGYYGIKLRNNSFSLEPKLAKESGQIYVYLPTQDEFVEYDYQYDAKDFQITLKYNSSFKQNGTVKILIPLHRGDKAIPPKKQDIIVSIDNQNIDFDLITVNSDVFVEFHTDFQDHTAVVTLLKAIKLK